MLHTKYLSSFHGFDFKLPGSQPLRICYKFATVLQKNKKIQVLVPVVITRAKIFKNMNIVQAHSEPVLISEKTVDFVDPEVRSAAAYRARTKVLHS